MNVVFLISIQNSERAKNQSHYFSIKSWNKWAEKNNAVVFVLDQELYDVPQWNKIMAFRLLEANGIEYNKILYVDADTIVHPDMPNVFEFPDNIFYGVRNYGSMDWVIRSIENYSKFVFDDFELDWAKYINSGFMLFDKSHRPLFEWLIDFKEKNETKLKYAESLGVGKDQPVINFALQINNIEMKILPYEYNMQDMIRFEVLYNNLYLKYGWVYHFNCGVKPTPKHWAETTYKKLYE